jgi:hypothetical protein
MLEDAEPEILAFYAFPAAHWRKLRSTNPLERFNKEVGRRTDVVGIFPDDRSSIAWIVGERMIAVSYGASCLLVLVVDGRIGISPTRRPAEVSEAMLERTARLRGA